MVVNGMLSDERYQKLKNVPIVTVSEKSGMVRSIAPHFMEYVRQQLEGFSEKYGYNLYRDGLNIYTTIDYRMQKYANDAVANHLKEYQALFNKNWKWDENKSLLVTLIDKAIRNSQIYRNASSKDERAYIYNDLKNNKSFIDSIKSAETKVQVGFVAIEPSTGQIKAMVGGENLGRGLNHVTGIRRQPGSAFKPIVYTTAIDNGYYPAYTILNQKFDYNGWSPSNADSGYGGYMTLREALAHSVNVVSGRMTISEVAPPAKVVKYAKRMGINSSLPPYPSIALGTTEVTPLELTSAYGTLANNGVHVNPIGILKIEDKNGILIDQFIPEYGEAVSPQTAEIMTAMMQDVLAYGTGAGVGRYFHRPAAGKTGTTQDFADAWFVGYTPQLVAGVWVGFDDHQIKFTDWYGQGARAALPIWAIFMEETYKNLDLPLEYFHHTAGVDTVTFCLESMNLGDPRIATPNCPTVYRDIINSKYMPRECEIHQNSDAIIREDKRGDAGW
jgi:penicillin-binding protein 1A